VGELVAAGLGGARSRAIAFKAIADGLPPQYRLRTRLVRAPYPQVNPHEAALAPSRRLMFVSCLQMQPQIALLHMAQAQHNHDATIGAPLPSPESCMRGNVMALRRWWRMSCSCMPGTMLWQTAGSMWSTSWMMLVPYMRRWTLERMHRIVIVFTCPAVECMPIQLQSLHRVWCNCELKLNICRRCIS